MTERRTTPDRPRLRPRRRTPGRLLRHGAIGALAVFLLCGPPPGAARQSDPDALAAPTPLDPHQVQTFIESIVPEALATSGSPGAVVAVVRGEEVLLLEGYGVADVETGAPVDPERTLFRLGSITKPLVGLAVLRLAERGVLDLDAPVDRYLGEIRIPAGFARPVTLRDLLTHRGGFDADLSFSARPPGSPPVSAGRIERRLDRVRPPGGPAAYDVVGFGLAGLVLESVTGQSLRTVLGEEVFRPLGMTRSTVGLPEASLPHFARCHVSLSPRRVRTCPHLELTAPFRGSGSAAAPAADVAVLMQALLRATSGHDGPGGARLLSPEGFSRFLDFDQYRLHPAGPGLGLGIRELDRSGRRAFGHGGGIHGFDNAMELFPDAGVGIYVGLLGGPEQVYDARLSSLPALLPDPSVPESARRARSRLERLSTLFAEALLPKTPEWPPAPSVARPVSMMAEAEDLAGFYVHNRYRSDNLMVELSRLALTVDVEALGPAALRIGGHGPYRRIGPLAYEDDDGHRVLFRLGTRSSEPSVLAFGGDPYATYERQSPVRRPALSVFPALLAAPLLLTGAVYLLPRFPAPRRRTAVLWVGGGLLFLVSLALELEYATWWIEVRGWSFLAWGVRGALLSSVALALAGGVSDLRAAPSPGTSRSWRRLAERFHRSLLRLASVALAWCTVLWAG